MYTNEAFLFMQSPLAVSAGSTPPQYIGFDMQLERIQVRKARVA